MSTTTLTLDCAGCEEPRGFKSDARRLLLLALPSIGFSLSRILLGQMDFVMLSRTGTEPTAAINPATFFVFLVQSFGMGLAMCTQTFASQALGAGRKGVGAAFAWQSAYVAAFFAAISPLIVSLMPSFWAWVNHTSTVQAMEVAYCQITLWSISLAVLCAGLDGFFNGVQKPRVTLIAILAAVLVNGFFNYVLIFGALGFPVMGIRGAAIATVLSWSVRLGILMVTFLSPGINKEFNTRSQWRPDKAKLGKMLTIGGPTGAQWMLDIGSWFVFIAVLIGGLGETVLAASNIAINYTYFSFMPAIGVGIAVSTLVGHAIGARQPAVARRYARVGMIIAGVYMGVLGIGLLLGGRWLIGLFSPDDTVQRIGALMLIWVAVFQVFDAMQIVYTNALRGAGDTKWPAMAVALHCWVIFVGGGWVMVRFVPSWGYHGPWMTATLYIAVLGCVLWGRWWRGRWEKIDLLGHHHDLSAHPETVISTELISPDAVVATAPQD